MSKYKMYDILPVGVCLISKDLKYNNTQARDFVEDYFIDKKINSKSLEYMLKQDMEAFIVGSYYIKKSIYKKDIILIIQNVKSTIAKLHMVRHNIKDSINPLAMLSVVGLDTSGMVRVASKNIDELTIESLLW